MVTPGAFPERTKKQQAILAAAGKLFAERGYRKVGMNDIGAALGVSGPSVYRHFPGKVDILIAVMDDICKNQLERMHDTVSTYGDPGERLQVMVAQHMQFVLEERENFQTWSHDFNVLPDEDRHRLRYLMHLYMAEWTRTVRQLRPEIEEAHAVFISQAAVSLLQSAAEHTSALTDEVMSETLIAMALTALRVGSATAVTV